MKKQFKYLALFFIIPFIANGCYTVLWTPEDDLPDQTNYQANDSYYYYMEDYNYYYDYPWWLSFTPPGRENSGKDQAYERDKGTTTVRNNGSGRDNSGSEREILNTPPPTRTNTPSSGSNDSSESVSKTRTESTNSGNSNTNTRQSSGSSGNNTRNNDGNRNNGRGR